MAEEGFGGFGDWFNAMNPQGNPLELASMLQHDPEGVIPALVQQGITPQDFEGRFGAGADFGTGGGMTSGQLLSGSGVLQRYPQFDESRAPAGGLGAAAPGASASAPLVPTPVQTLSIPRPAAVGAPAPAQAAAEEGVAAPGAVATKPTAEYGVAGGQVGPPNPADSAQAQAEKKQVADLVKLLSGVKAPPAPVVQMPRPGTAGPPALRPINQESAISALLQRALGGQRGAPSLSSVVRR